MLIDLVSELTCGSGSEWPGNWIAGHKPAWLEPCWQVEPAVLTRRICQDACVILRPARPYSTPMEGSVVEWFFIDAPSRIPESFCEAVFHTALWVIHSAVIKSFTSMPHLAFALNSLIAHKLGWIMSQVFYGNQSSTMCRELVDKWSSLPGLVLFLVQNQAVFVLPETFHQPLTPALPSPQSFSLGPPVSLDPPP
ncbi:hypothetical protein DSO57_1023330 [Entomophthora muscae]|uniref:Uncharacterized protein n=1 Tax=Entomophthora muscae TaxID=34485 RepID=A0ACC2UCQ6_9FUNG|nr:hypothetical protein DSO57_1023330 [Entomophthora muscae]